MSANKNFLGLVCPCCEGQVTEMRYSFKVITPPKVAEYFVCAECEAVLMGDDPAARADLEHAFFDYLASI